MSRTELQLDDLARAAAEGVPRRVIVGRIATLIAAFVAGDPAAALGAKKRCAKGRRRCGSICCKPGYVCKTKKHKQRCVCPKPKKVCGGRCVNAKTDERNCGTCGHRCASGETCVAGTCTKPTQQPTGTDQPPAPTCTDGVRNGNETDVDCGGPSCPQCANGRSCATATDCVSGVCAGGACVAPPPGCSADVCGAQHSCPPCAIGKPCGGGGDCASGHCLNGVCRQCNADANCPPAAIGSCHKAVCASGVCGSAIDDANVPDDGNDCTLNICTAGVPSNPSANTGTPCAGGACDDSGNCVPGCTQASDCPGTDTECRTRTCDSGTCGFSYAGSGTVLAAQTAGDCKKNVCDGAGGTMTQNDDTDLPNDGNQCTYDTCTGGVGSNPPRPASTACNQNGGTMCDGAGTCV